MPADGMAPNRALIPYGMKPPPAPRLLAWNLNSSTMMVRTGMATFHQVMPALTFENSLMAEEVDRGEQRHQHDRHREAEPGDVDVVAL